MCRPVGAHPLAAGMASPFKALASVSAQVALPQLDVLWHYDCVVSPHSSAATGANLQRHSPKLSAAPCSPASNHPAHPRPSLPPRSSGSHAAFSPSSDHSKSPVCQPHDHYTVHQRQLLQRVFNTFDEDGDGTVSIHEISRMFEKLGIESSMESLLASLVTKSQGHVDEQEFLSLYESVCCSDPSARSSSLQADVDQDLLAAFHVFDKDGNGFISPAELQSVLCSLGFRQARQLEACVDMIAKVDENGDGHVDFFEFKKLFLIEVCASSPAT